MVLANSEMSGLISDLDRVIERSAKLQLTTTTQMLCMVRVDLMAHAGGASEDELEALIEALRAPSVPQQPALFDCPG